MQRFGFFIASTGQNIGKTTTSLGLVAGLLKRGIGAGFMKPVGQEQLQVDSGEFVDKDVVLFKEHFKLKDHYSHMSPVLIPQGFTKDFLDKKIQSIDLKSKIFESYTALSDKNEFMIVEGTGHVGVGSIINLNNAQVAHMLDLPMILIASGGLGSAFDELALNRSLCEKHKTKILGVILNRVKEDKIEMISHYMSKALKEWNLPLLGCVPFDTLLSNPTMQDLEMLFSTSLISGEEFRLRHFETIRLVATSVDVFRELIQPNQIVITPANREDIILAIVSKQLEYLNRSPKKDLGCGLILTGEYPPRHFILDQIQKACIPMLYTAEHSHIALQMISNFTAKIRREDKEKITEAIEVVETHINFDALLRLTEFKKR
ncbi:MAG: cobyrinic acid a,c-diamide synthase [Chlamydiae bacterium]|nr:cobyrinic acid a,c-diamide synthase [Chlamydiota bacterium]